MTDEKLSVVDGCIAWRAPPTVEEGRALVAEVRRLRADLERVTAERDRLQRAWDAVSFLRAGAP